MEKATYLICEISEGMFPDEKCVVVKDLGGNIVSSGFFPDRLIKENKLRVYVWKIEDGKALIGSLNAGSYGFMNASSIWVPESFIVTVEE